MSELTSSKPMTNTTPPEPVTLVTDAELLTQFLKLKHETPFAAIVERYGQMVFAVALRIVRDRHSAEDVTQATFFLLAREAKQIKRRDALSSWLHGVAIRLSKKVLKRRSREQVRNVVTELEIAENSFEEIHSLFEQQILDEELQGLPIQFRDPLVLHFLQGKTYEETAQQLGVTVGAIEGRMKRGKRELHLRLTKRGVGLGAALVALSWSQEAAAEVIRPELMTSIVENGMAAFQGTAFTPSCSPEAVYLAGKEVTMLTTTKIAILTCTVLVAAGAGWIGHAGVAGDGAVPGSRLSGSNISTTVDLAQADSFEPFASDQGLVADPPGESSPQPQSTAINANEPTAQLPIAALQEALQALQAAEKNTQAGADLAQKIKQLQQAQAAVLRANSELQLIQQQLNVLKFPPVPGYRPDGGEAQGQPYYYEQFNPFGGRPWQQLHTGPFAGRSPDDLNRVSGAAGSERGAATVPDRSDLDDVIQFTVQGSERGAATFLEIGGVPQFQGKITVEKNESPAAQKIEKALSAPNPAMAVTDTPLRDVVEFLGTNLSIPILIDEVALSDEGMTLDDEFSLNLPAETTSSEETLNLLLESRNLTHVIKNGVLLITSKEVANEQMETRVYDVRPLNLTDPEALSDVLLHTTGRDSWSELGGMGELSYLNGSFIIRQSQSIHKEIEVLLNQLVKQIQNNPNSPPWSSKYRMDPPGGYGGMGRAGAH